MNEKVFQKFYGSMSGRLSEESMKEILEDTSRTIIKFLDNQNKENTLQLVYAGLDVWYYTKYTALHYPISPEINKGAWNLSNFISDILVDFDSGILDLYFKYCDEERFIKIMDEDLEDLHKDFKRVWKGYKNARNN